jgi:ribosomal protein S18 acetylase RimI-like enzyme
MNSGIRRMRSLCYFSSLGHDSWPLFRPMMAIIHLVWRTQTRWAGTPPAFSDGPDRLQGGSLPSSAVPAFCGSSLVSRSASDPLSPSLPAAAAHPGIVIRCVGLEGDDGLTAELARAAAAAPGSGPRLTGAGIVAELAQRPGREVEAWLAFTADQDPPRAIGLVTLVKAGATPHSRWSMAWLLVHPAARRQGVGRRLTVEACRRAHQLGAAAIWVECRSDWREALGFWQACGFVPAGARVPS